MIVTWLSVEIKISKEESDMSIKTYIVLVMSIVLMSSCDNKEKSDATKDPYSYSYPFGGGVSFETSRSADSRSSEISIDSKLAKYADYTDAYDDGYENGYMDGEDDYLDNAGYEGQYNDDSSYEGQDRRDYERGYEEGYEEGYDDAKGEDGSDDGE